MSTRTKTTVKLTIDGRNLDAHEGETILEVARREGIDIPALCYEAGAAAWGGCRLCLVEVEGVSKLQAACTTPAAEGMVVKTDTPRVRARRESYLKMYLSDHNAYCEAPCTHACPTHIDIPAYLEALAAGDVVGATAIVRDELPFPAIMGYICPAYCEPVCRRGQVDEPVAICALHRLVSDQGPSALERVPSSGKRVAVVGGGPAGLAAAWFLAKNGHAVTIYDSEERLGGSLRRDVSEGRLPEEVLDRELQPLWEAGVRFRGKSDIGSEVDPDTLLHVGFDAVIMTLGDSRRQADRHTGRTSQEGSFAAGEAAEEAPSVIHAIAGGKRTALSVDAWLQGQDLPALEKSLVEFEALPYLRQLEEAPRLGSLGRRLAERSPVWLHMGACAEPAARATTLDTDKDVDLSTAQAEARRCLQCTCPSLGTCDLQRLGVEYGVTANELVKSEGRVRVLQPQQEHPFIRRDMERCIACGRCVRACRDVAGPACYEFTGRGFNINIDTPYGDSLQLSKCISCGRCVTTCPTGALTFNQRVLDSFLVDESRCIMCGECVDVCPVDALAKTDHFEQARLRWLELVAQGSRLAGGHRMCAGCGAPTVVRQVLMGTSDPVVISSATGCLEVSTTIYPYTSWKSSFIHTAFENSAATLSGVETAFRALKKKGLIEENVKFVAFGGDGGTYDIGLQSLSGAMDRGHSMLYVCYDNGAYMNTGFQRSGATPIAAWTTTSPVGEETAGKLEHRKNLTEIMIAHSIEYVAQASPHDPRDLVRKAAKALAIDGPTFLNVLAPCPRGWRSEGAESIDLAREAVNTCYWPLFEYEKGEYRLTYRPHHKQPLAPWLKRQGRFAHLFQPGSEELLRRIETWVDEEWEKLLRKCHEPSEAEWQGQLETEPGTC